MAPSFPFAVVDRAGGLRVVRERDERARQLAAEGRWPAWAPGGRHLAASRLDNEGGQVRSRVHVYRADGDAAPELLYESAAGVLPVIAPRVAHYLSWSPGVEFLGVVAQGQAGLELTLHAGDGSGASRVVATGAPIFSNWSPDGSRLAVHAGPELTVIDGSPPHSRHIIEERALGFRVPAWSPSGRELLYAVAASAGVAVMSFDVDAAEIRELARFDGGVALSWPPESERPYVAVTRNPEAGVFDEAWAVEAQSGRLKPVVRGPFVALSWAPGGERFALVVPAQTGDGRYLVRVCSEEGEVLATSEALVPSADLRTHFGFFDQYAVSHPLWAPDGSCFLLAGRLVSDAVSGSFGDPVGNLVFRWAAARGAPLEVVLPGDLAVFAPP